jgi:hypothetical protein
VKYTESITIIITTSGFPEALMLSRPISTVVDEDREDLEAWQLQLERDTP